MDSDSAPPPAAGRSRGKLESWAQSHKGLIAIAGAAAAVLALLLIHPRSRQAASSATQGAISYIPAQFTQQPDAQSTSIQQPQTATPPSGPASDAGFFFGPPPTVGGPFSWLWRYTQKYLGGRPDLPSSAMFGPPPGTPGGPTDSGPFSWEWGFTNQLPQASFQPAQGPNIGLKTQLSNVPQSSAVMGGVG